jgi:hypothetical protein
LTEDDDDDNHDDKHGNQKQATVGS